MNLTKAKYTLLAASISLAACQREDDGYTEQPTSAEGNITFAATFESKLSKAALNFDGDSPASSTKILTYFQQGDAMSVFDGNTNNKFTTKDNGATATFAGTAKETGKGYYAIFPYNAAATIGNDGTISTTIPTKQSGGKLDGIVAVAHTDAGTNAFTLRNATAIIAVRTNDQVTSLKVEASKPIAGQTTIKLDQNGIPTATGADAKTIELTDAPNGGYISVIPTTGVNIDVTYTLKDGNTKTANFTNITLTRSQILDLGTVSDLYTLTFDVSKIPGASVDNISVKANTKPILPASIGSGITFNGWIGSDGQYYNKGEVLPTVTSDMSFVAIAGNEKVLIFQYNGKSMFIQFKEGEQVTMPTITEAPAGKVFKGWTTSQTAVKPEYEAGKQYTVTVNNTTRTIYAFYEAKDQTITLDANGGKFADNTTKKTITHKWGVSAELQPEPTYDGHWFKGWDGADTHDYKSDATFKAIWGNMSTITYKDFNGNTAKTVQYPDGGTTTISNDIQLGAIIKDWNTKQDGSGTAYIPGQTYSNITGNITLYPIKSDKQSSGIDQWTIEDF